MKANWRPSGVTPLARAFVLGRMQVPSGSGGSRRSTRMLMAHLRWAGSTVTRCLNAGALPQVLSFCLTA